MDSQRTKNLLGAIVTGGFGGVLWLLRHEKADLAHGIAAHDSGIIKLGAYIFWALAFLMLMGAVGVLSERTLSEIARNLPVRRRRVVHHHHHHYHPSAPPPAPQAQPPANGDAPQVSKWTD